MTSRSERGAVTPLAVSVAVLLTIGALVAVQVAGLVRLRHQVAAAADLAALAASRASIDGEDACTAARELARRNQASVVRCRMDYDVATVTTRGESERWWGHRFAFETTARAAPDFYLDG